MKRIRRIKGRDAIQDIQMKNIPRQKPARLEEHQYKKGIRPVKKPKKSSK